VPDITMCTGRGCELRGRCYRFLAEPDEMQSFFSNPPVNKQTGECTEFWRCVSRSEKKRLDTQNAP
jgi:hypothetical protein